MPSFVVRVLVTVLSASAAFSDVQCADQKAKYASLNEPLIITSSAERKALSKEREEALTADLQSFVDAQILRILNDDKLPIESKTSQLADYLRCLQTQPQYLIWKDETNTPLAISSSIS